MRQSLLINRSEIAAMLLSKYMRTKLVTASYVRILEQGVAFSGIMCSIRCETRIMFSVSI